MGKRSFFLGVIILPLALWALLLVVQFLTSGQVVGVLSAVAQLALMIAGGWLLWRWNALPLTRHDEAAAEHTRHLEAVRAATLALTTELELTEVLQKVIDLSRELATARYAALGVLDEAGIQIEQFITSGMSSVVRARIGEYPQGRGLLGILVSAREPLRIADISKDPRSVGFPARHPPMTSFLGVPIISKGRIFGNLYLTDKMPAGIALDHADRNTGGDPDDKLDDNPEIVAGIVLPFTAEDQEVVEMFARQAAIAIENALLLRRSRQLAVAQERERFAMDLHDGLIQSVYAVGLALDGSRRRLADDPDMARSQIDQAIDGLNDVISDIRNYILNLRARRFEEQGLEDGLRSIIRELRANSFLRVDSTIDPDAAQSATRSQTTEVLYITQEALTNVRKHALASVVTISLTRVDDAIVLTVADNGRGFAVEQVQFGADSGPGDGKGNGLHNIRTRTAKLNGALEIDAQLGHGTNVTVTVPVLSG